MPNRLYTLFLAHPTAACFYFLLAFWFLAFHGIKLSHLIARRPLSDGPSLIPVFPVLPAIALAVAAAINAVFSPVGMLLVVVIHFIYPLWALCHYRQPSNK